MKEYESRMKEYESRMTRNRNSFGEYKKYAACRRCKMVYQKGDV